MRFFSGLSVCAFVALVSFGSATGFVSADLILVNNAGFEADFAADGTFPTFVPSGWQTFDPNNLLADNGNAVGVLNPTGTTFFPDGAPAGDNVGLIYLSADHDSGPVGLSQVLTDQLQPNTRYTLTVEVGNIASGTGLPPYDVFGFFDLDGFPGYQVQLLAGGTVIAEDNNSLFGTIAEGTFETIEISINISNSHPLLGQALEIRLINLNQTDTVEDPGIEVDFDQVHLNATAIPEPTLFSVTVLLTLSLFYVLSRGHRPGTTKKSRKF